MNDTKWAELVSDLSAIPTEKRTKFVDNDDPTNWQPGLWIPAKGFIEGAIEPERLASVEWIEIKKLEVKNRAIRADLGVTDWSSQIGEILGRKKYDTEENEETVRIYGYRRIEN